PGLPRSGPARLLVLLAASGSIAGGAYAFTAGATVPATNVGSGNATVSSYTATGVTYTIDASLDKTTAVSFTLNTTATDVAAALVASPGTGDWIDCGAATGVSHAVSCDFSGSPVANASVVKLSLIAVSGGSVTLP